MISASALSLLVMAGLGLSSVAIALLVALVVIDWYRGELW